jgi:2-polyprenyl-3-methyl-5-hydroxy-6-metoxy-1,4-benzoquinol methylase
VTSQGNAHNHLAAAALRARRSVHRVSAALERRTALAGPDPAPDSAEPAASPPTVAAPAPSAEPAPQRPAYEQTRLADGVTAVELDAVNELLAEAAEIERTGGSAECNAFLGRHQLVYDPGAFSSDPFSEEYRRAQIDLYKVIADVDSYVPSENELMQVHIEARLRQPAPFDAGSTGAAADQVIAYGFVLRMLDLKPGDRLIEYGPGQGNLSVLLATIGVEVTAIDISPEFVELIRRRAQLTDLPLTAVLGEFGDPPPDGEPVNAILFYEAFHHAADHQQLVRTLRERLAPGGLVVFAGEPIMDSPAQPWVGPWGVRLDGISLWAIRQHHCLELGYASPYFREMLARNGFGVEYHECRETAIGNSWVARPLN